MKSRRTVRLVASVPIVIGAILLIRHFEGGETVQRDGLTFAGPSPAGDLERSALRHAAAAMTRQ